MSKLSLSFETVAIRLRCTFMRDLLNVRPIFGAYCAFIIGQHLVDVPDQHLAHIALDQGKAGLIRRTGVPYC